jgi:hypothetical protein
MESSESSIEKITDTIETVITGIPAPIRKNFFKAFAQLCTAAVDVPVALLEGKSSEIRAITEARIQIVQKEGESISSQIKVPDEYISKASAKFAAKVIKEQINLDEITLIAAKNLSSDEKNINLDSNSEISDDWLNEFENLARTKSSDDMRLIFGKILSGEISRPGKFSIRTVRLVSQLDNEAAKIFLNLCNCSVSFHLEGIIYDARVVFFSGSPGENSLSKYNLSFSNLNILQEYGLIIPEYSSIRSYSACIANENNVIGGSLYFQNRHYGLVPIDKDKFDKDLRFSGVAFTKAGKELLNIIPTIETENYKSDFIEFLNGKHLKLVELK